MHMSLFQEPFLEIIRIKYIKHCKENCCATITMPIRTQFSWWLTFSLNESPFPCSPFPSLPKQDDKVLFWPRFYFTGKNGKESWFVSDIALWSFGTFQSILWSITYINSTIFLCLCGFFEQYSSIRTIYFNFIL